jgi:hypothetical protein
MALSVAALVSYIIENEDLLVTKSLFGGKTSDLIAREGTVMTGVKYAEQINILATDAIFQNGTGCTRVSSGNTSISQRIVKIGDIAVVEDICVKTLNTVYLSKKLAKGSEVNDIPFEQQFGDLKARTIAKQLEIALWQGDTNSAGNSTIAYFDGLIKLIDVAGVAVNGNPTNITVGTGIVASNVVGIVNGVWGAIPADVQGQEDLRIFCGWDTFYTYIAAYTTANLYNFFPKGNEVGADMGEIIIPGTNYRLTAVHGLDGKNRLFAIRTSNLFMGVDLEDEYSQFSLMEDQFKDYVRFKAHFKAGVNVAFPAEIVSFKLV